MVWVRWHETSMGRADMDAFERWKKTNGKDTGQNAVRQASNFLAVSRASTSECGCAHQPACTVLEIQPRSITQPLAHHALPRSTLMGNHFLQALVTDPACNPPCSLAQSARTLDAPAPDAGSRPSLCPDAPVAQHGRRATAQTSPVTLALTSHPTSTVRTSSQSRTSSRQK